MLEFPLINDTSRKIIHIDMDAFFASVEERDNPDLIGKPVVIGANPLLTGGRGVVSTCNYVARQYGIHSAMSSKEAYERCPKAIFISGHYELYREVGRQIREIFYSYTDLVEPMSIDEAYLDVTHNKKNINSAIKIARMIQEEIWQKVRLTCSAGVSYNKFLAKLASDYEKPAGMTVILPGQAEDFLKEMPIEKFHGVGKKSVERLHDIGVYTGKDLQEMKEIDLIDRFGRFGYDLYRHARGISNSPVKPNRIRKSVGSERTYRKLLYAEEDVKAELAKNAERVARTLEKMDARGRSIVIKVRYSDFETLTKRITLEDPTRSLDLIQQTAFEIYDQLDENTRGIRLLGVTVTSLVYGAENITLDLGYSEKGLGKKSH